MALGTNTWGFIAKEVEREADLAGYFWTNISRNIF